MPCRALPPLLPLLPIPADGKYHRIDRFGHKLPTVVVPLTLEEEEEAASAADASSLSGSAAAAVAGAAGSEGAAGGGGAGPAPEHIRSQSSVEGEMDYMNNRVSWLGATREGAWLAATTPGHPVCARPAMPCRALCAGFGLALVWLQS